jgi:hypothetical protein
MRLSPRLRISLKLAWLALLTAALVVASKSDFDFVYRAF